MKKARCIISMVFCLILSAFIFSASAEIYRYTDEGGTVRFTDDLNMVPVDQRAIADEYRESQAPEEQASSDAEAPEPALAAEPESPEAAPGEEGPSQALETEVLAESRRLSEAREALDAERIRLVELQERLSKTRKVTHSSAEAQMHRAMLLKYKQDAESYEKKRQAFHEDLARYNEKVDVLNRGSAESGGEPESE